MLDVKAFGLAAGIMWGAGVFLLGLLAMATGFAAPMVAGLGSGYLGYDATVAGSIIGGIWGFVDAGIGGVVFAWLYNSFTGARSGGAKKK